MTPVLAHRPRAERAFECLYHDHVHAVYRYALAVLHNEADAEDVTQTTFLSAYRAFERGDRPERPHNWLIKIAHNVCRQRFRDSSRRPREVAFDEALTTPIAPGEADDIPSATEIRRALGFLGFNQRAALVMRELEGRSYAEIAQILDVSVGAVETLIFRARRALREQLEGGLTCAEAELTLSRLQERKLSRAERGALRAHLRECKDCAVLERRCRSQRSAIMGLAAIPLPSSLTTFAGGSSIAGAGAGFAGLGLGAKIAAVVAVGVIGTGVGHEVVKADAVKNSKSNAPAAPAAESALSPSARSGSNLIRARASARPASKAAQRRGNRGRAHARGRSHPSHPESASGNSSRPGRSSSRARRGNSGGSLRDTVTRVLPQVPVRRPRVPRVKVPKPRLPRQPTKIIPDPPQLPAPPQPLPPLPPLP